MRILIITCCLLTAGIVNAQRNNFRNITEKNGMIGIGTNNPDEKLTVKGKIHTQEVLVDLNGAVAPDYVFESYFQGYSDLNPGYKVPRLSEVAKYIQEHHHLPGIPSAKSISENGLNLKELNLKLLEKVEELTLYTIEQDKRIKALENALQQEN